MIRLLLSSAFADCVEQCCAVLLEGGVVTVPTDTVYGLICAADAPAAARRIARIKGRPDEKPFALFVASWERLCREAITPSETAERLARRYWPGGLTLVVGAEASCPSAQNGTVGARCPDTAFLQAVLARCGGVLINTSLNRSGEPPVCSLEECDAILAETDLVIDGEALPPSAASTVVHCGKIPYQILREGAISAQAIAEALGD